MYGTFTPLPRSERGSNRSNAATALVMLGVCVLALVAMTAVAIHTTSNEQYMQQLADSTLDRELEKTNDEIKNTEAQLSVLQDNKPDPETVRSLLSGHPAPKKENAPAPTKKAVTKKGTPASPPAPTPTPHWETEEANDPESFDNVWENDENKLSMSPSQIAQIAKQISAEEGSSEAKRIKNLKYKKYQSNLLKVEQQKNAHYKKMQKAFDKDQLNQINANMKDIMAGSPQGLEKKREQLVREIVHHYSEIGTLEQTPLLDNPPPMHDESVQE
eukprot:JP446760.1.p1 GENE.JP446760.1~~JP446760.1.p1  ORF type:complete len:280 (-),score=84.12 JP446760.1:31-849(-)